MKLNENQFFLIAVSLIEKKQALLKKTMDNYCIELINEIDQLLDKLEKSNPELEGIIDLIYKTQNYLL
jgi:mevalonate kinase|tara:strand:+ start:516 stop:719 length:204 start_codon:yes stop_codon:yes gene_type:complete